MGDSGTPTPPEPNDSGGGVERNVGERAEYFMCALKKNERLSSEGWGVLLFKPLISRPPPTPPDLDLLFHMSSLQAHTRRQGFAHSRVSESKPCSGSPSAPTSCQTDVFINVSQAARWRRW